MYLIICYELKYTLNCADIQMGKLVKYFIDFSGRIARRVEPCMSGNISCSFSSLSQSFHIKLHNVSLFNIQDETQLFFVLSCNDHRTHLASL